MLRDTGVFFFSVAILFLFVVFVMRHRHCTSEIKWDPSLSVCLCVCVSCSLVCPPLDHLLILFCFWFVWLQVWFWYQGVDRLSWFGFRPVSGSGGLPMERSIWVGRSDSELLWKLRVRRPVLVLLVFVISVVL